MRIEKEGEYRNARGEKVLLFKNWCDGECWPFEDRRGTWYRFDGTSCRGIVYNRVPGDDIISEWSDGPIVTETVQRIEPGVYGPLEVTGEAVLPLRCGEDEPEEPVVYAALVPSYLCASDWRELARAAHEIAEYLDELD